MQISLFEFLGEERLLEWFYSKNKNNSLKTIGYRRVSGKIGLTSMENGIRGAWVEKRVALFKSLLEFGYKIIPFSEPTDATKNDGFEYENNYIKCDVLILEFGGTNLQFYKKDWDKTLEIIKHHKGRIIFINDDPDLSFLWELLPDENWSRWTIAANAVNCDEVRRILKCPISSRVVDFPMSSGMEFAEFHEGGNGKVVYIGRPNGRMKYFKEFTKSKALEISGKDSEWKDFPSITIVNNPQQRDRRSFYQKYNGCLAVFDEKHKISGWRTGRAYHAVYAGIPVCAPVGNAGLDWCFLIQNADDLNSFARLDVNQRKKIWLDQMSLINNKPMDLINL